MHLSIRALTLACALALSSAGPVFKKFNITIGYLTILTGDVTGRQGITISGATSLALDELNHSTDILPDVNIILDWRDTQGKPSSELITDMASKGAVAFFGPEGHCYAEAQLVQSINLPMFSYKCADVNATSFPNFVKTDPVSEQAVTSVISLLRYYRWNKFSIMYEDTWATEAQMLEAHAWDNEMTVNHKRLVGMTAYLYPSESDLYRIIEETQKTTRIYVYLGSTDGLISTMSAMDKQNLFDKGEYMIIYVDKDTYMPRRSLQYLLDRLNFLHCPNVTESFIRRARSLLVVATAETSAGFEQFTDQVNDYDNLEPFYFPQLMGMKKYISIYGAYLYDSIKMYAKSLDELIREDTQKEKLTYEKLMNIATNGSRIVETVIKNSPYKSVSGLPIRLNQRGVADGCFSLLSFKEKAWSVRVGENCTHTMVPVGNFEIKDINYPIFHLDPRLAIDWPDSVKPDDEPPCGYHEEKCATHL